MESINTTKRIYSKSYRANEKTIQRITELLESFNSTNTKYGKPLYSESDLIEHIVEKIHIEHFDEGSTDYATQKMETIIQSNLELLMNKHMEPFAQALNHLNNTTSKTLDAAYILMYYGELLPKDQQFINELLIGTESYHRVLEEANRVKQKMMGDE